jgi:sulfate permease, SulP family
VLKQRGRLQLPGLTQLRHYQPAWLAGDLLAGVTVAAYLVPQCMAYGELAGVGPIAGLWAIMPAMLLYAVLGSSPQLSVGPESTTAIMTAAVVGPLAESASDYALLAAMLALLVGLICIGGAIAGLGFLANLLSRPILVGYMGGVAILMMVGQLGKISRMDLAASSVGGQLKEFFSQLDQIHWPTLILSGLVLAFLLGLQRWRPNAPGPLLAVLLATAAVWLLHLEQVGVAVVGEIPAGLPQLVLPVLSGQALTPLVAAAIGIAVVGYSDTILTARAFASRRHNPIDANQELLALGVVNLGAGLLQGFPISSSGSRTAIGDAMGSKSQGFSLVALVVLLLVLLVLKPVLALFPKAALGAIVIYAAIKLIDVAELLRLHRFRRSELLLALTTTVGVLTTDLLVGVAIAISLSVIDLFARIANPHDAVLGKVPGLPGRHDIDDWPGAVTIPGLVLYRYDAPLCFANAENFKRRALAAIEAETAPVMWFVLDTEAVVNIDITAIDMLEALHDELAERSITLALTRVKQDLYRQLKKTPLVEKIGPERIFLTLHTAIEGFEQYRQRSG